MKAAGLTLRTIEALIEKKLVDGGYFVSPQVTVEVTKYRSQNVYVLGEVRVPGQYALTGNMTVLQVLAAAGSPTPAAAGTSSSPGPPASRRSSRMANLAAAARFASA